MEDHVHTEIVYGGAAGGGKSWLGCLWMLSACIRYPGSRWLMGRSVLKTLKETTLNSFFDVAMGEGLKSGRDFTYNAQTHVINLAESQILLKDLASYPSDPNFDELGSLEITGAFIDEANQISEKAKAIVGTRIRYKLDEFGLSPKILMTCNPAKNWVYRDFYKPWKDDALEPYRAFIPAMVHDNPKISVKYVENLQKLKGPDRERLLLGNWDYDDDPARLMEHDAIMDLWTNELKGKGKYIIVDVARYGHDKTVISLWEGMALVHLSVLDQSSIVETAAAIIQLSKQEDVPRSHIVVDDDGIGGGVVDLLPGCLPFSGGAKPIPVKGKDQNYLNLKAQCSYEAAQYVNDREMAITTEAYRENFEEELPHIKRDKIDSDGKLRILPKDKVKESLGHSPDFADIVMMRMLPELRSNGVMAASIQRKAKSIVIQKRREMWKNTWR